jgi:hypothetical protein
MDNVNVQQKQMIEVQFLKIPVLWNVTLCKLDNSYQNVGIPYLAIVFCFR